MALGELLTKLPVDSVGEFAGRCVHVMFDLVEVDREWSVIDAACAAMALVILRFPETVQLDDMVEHDDDAPRSLPLASNIAKKMFTILPLNVGHASSVLVALMRIAAVGVVQAVEDYVSSNIRAYTHQNFAVSGTPHALA
jgi:hypothetical protein